MRDSSGDDWYTIAEAARAVKRSRRTVERWLQTGLPTQRVRGTRYILSKDLFARLRLILMTEPEVKTRRETQKSDVAPP
jgi:excisionase family DNA binding protein